MSLTVQYRDKDSHGYNLRVHLSETHDRLTLYPGKGDRDRSTGEMSSDYRKLGWGIRPSNNSTIRIHTYYDSDSDAGPESLWLPHNEHPTITQNTFDAEEAPLGGLRFTVEAGSVTKSVR